MVYSFGALIVARAADRFSAPLVLSASLAVWSISTVLSGFAQNFLQLVVARSGVAAGESGCNPAAHAAIARLYPARNRATVLAIFCLGLPIGSTLGLILGGWINDAMGWRAAFFLVGLPGLVLAAIVWISLRRSSAQQDSRRDPMSFIDAVRYLLMRPSFRHMLIGCALFAIVFYAISVFTPAFLMRVHHLSATQVGLALGIASGVGAMTGTLSGGALADVMGRKDVRWRQLVPALGVTLCVPVALGAWLIDDLPVALVLLAALYFVGMINAAPTWANVQLLAPDEMRATATAIVVFCSSLIGASVGPLLVGWTSDLLAPRFGALSLRYALCAIAVFMAWSGLHYFLAARHMQGDLAERE
jgi:predicted MFS family arabinose efflux permease